MLSFVPERPTSAASLALALSRWLDERSIDGRAALADLLAELFTDEERREVGAGDEEDGEPTPPLLGDDAAARR